MRHVWMCGCVLALSMLAGSVAAQAPGATSRLSFGGKAVAIDVTSCSPENSSNGKNRAIAATNMGSASSFTVQFATLAPAAGMFTTVADEDDLGTGKVLVGLGGKSFDGTYVARAGQKVTLARAGATYTASFADLAVIAVPSMAASAKTASGTISCQ